VNFCRIIYLKIHICSDINEVKTKIPANMLPKDFGGEGPSCEDLQGNKKPFFLYYKNSFLYSRNGKTEIYGKARIV
jgi:hypothetical protein